MSFFDGERLAQVRQILNPLERLLEVDAHDVVPTAVGAITNATQERLSLVREPYRSVGGQLPVQLNADAASGRFDNAGGNGRLIRKPEDGEVIDGVPGECSSFHRVHIDGLTQAMN